MYVSVSVHENQCFKMEAFISKDTEIKYKIEREHGNAISLDLSSLDHDLTVQEIKKGLDVYKAGSFIEFTSRILSFRLLHNILDKDIKLNFFCAYWSEIDSENNFKGELELLWDNAVDSILEGDMIDSQSTLATKYNYWLGLTPEMMLYEIRLHAPDMKEIHQAKFNFVESSIENSKYVNKCFL